MQRTLEDVSSRYGAPFGRVELHKPGLERPRLALQRVPVNSGGYDRGGAYWGLGAPLYWYSDDAGEISGWIRATSRSAAKTIVRAAYPGARFYR